MASWAFHIHEEGIGALHQVLLLVLPLLEKAGGDPLQGACSSGEVVTSKKVSP